MERLVVCFLALCGLAPALAAQQLQQEEQLVASAYRNNAVYLEFGGPGFLYSLGYERTWYQSRAIKVISSVGLGYTTTINGSYRTQEWILRSYIESDILFRIGNSSYVELGLAFAYYRSNYDFDAAYNHEQYLVPWLGYRNDFNSSRFFLKTGITPLFDMTYRPHINQPQYRDRTFPVGFSRPWLALAWGIGFDHTLF